MSRSNPFGKTKSVSPEQAQEALARIRARRKAQTSTATIKTKDTVYENKTKESGPDTDDSSSTDSTRGIGCSSPTDSALARLKARIKPALDKTEQELKKESNTPDNRQPITKEKSDGESRDTKTDSSLSTRSNGRGSSSSDSNTNSTSRVAAILARAKENNAKRQAAIQRHETTVKEAEEKAKSSFTVPAKEEKEVELQLPQNAIEVHNTEVLRGKADITYSDLNEEQKQAVTLAENDTSFCLIGAAGSGKTTTTKMIAQVLAESGSIGELGGEHKFLNSPDPSIVFVSFTNQAVSNIREAVPERFKNNCLTIHKLLEYEPVFYEIQDPETHEMKKTMRYEPQRGEWNPINGITHVVVEEAGSVDLDLFSKLAAAIPPHVVFIFLGDLNQLPPVFGDAILGYKLIELPVVELVHSYRTDQTSPIRLLAYEVLEGKPLSDNRVLEFHTSGELELIPFKQRVEEPRATKQMGMELARITQEYFSTEGKSGFNYMEDVVLTPFNKRFGTIEFNKYIAQTVTSNLGTPTYEINCGLNKLYYAVGDIVYFNKNKWRIVEIRDNPSYIGTRPRPPSITMDRWGEDTEEEDSLEVREAKSAEDLEKTFEALAAMELSTSNEDMFKTASHEIVLEDLAGVLTPVTISQVGDMNELMLSYCLTVHKSQGSEWSKVFCVFHHSQAVMMKREILYTAITRARQYLRVYFSGQDTRPSGERKANESTFQKGIIKQYIPGKHLEEKLDYFRSKLRAQALKYERIVAKREGRKISIKNTNVDAQMAQKLLNQMMNSQVEMEMED